MSITIEASEKSQWGKDEHPGISDGSFPALLSGLPPRLCRHGVAHDECGDGDDR